MTHQETPSVKQQIMEEFKIWFFLHDEIPDEEKKGMYDWLSSALDRHAMSVVLQSVPEAIDCDDISDPETNDDYKEYGEATSWNACRLATLAKAREITNQ